MVRDRRGGPQHPRRSSQRYMAERAGARRTSTIPGASHAVAVSQPGATARLILEADAVRAGA